MLGATNLSTCVSLLYGLLLWGRTSATGVLIITLIVVMLSAHVITLSLSMETK